MWPKSCIICAFLLTAVGFDAVAGDDVEAVADTTVVAPADSTAGHRGLIGKLIDYINNSNKPKPSKKVDFSFIGGPFYSSESKFGIGLVAAANYTMDMKDTVPSPVSDVSLYGQITTSLLYTIGIRGNHFACHDGFHMTYDLKFFSFPTAFWGIGYEQARLNDNKVKYKDFHIGGVVAASWRLGHSDVYAGAVANFAWDRARDIAEGGVVRWDGQPTDTRSLGVGVTVNLDTRDNPTAPCSGWLIELRQLFYPRFMGNGGHSFCSTDIAANRYTATPWSGGIIAGRLHGFFSYGKTPWNMLGSIGGASVMRGYYEGRYRDKCEVDLTVELRQHVWRRSGIALWAGVASVFPKMSEIRFNRLLPCCGIGYRWEFKRHTNVRLDFGIGRGSTGIIFNINEAF